MVQKIWDWLHDRNWKTWIGHGLQGTAITGLAILLGLGADAGVFAVLIHFLLREAPGIYFAIKTKNHEKLVDGVFDFIAPLVGIWIALVLFT